MNALLSTRAVRRSPQTSPAQVLGPDFRVLSDRDLRLLDVRVPALLPLEAVEPGIPRLGERLDLLPHGHLSGPGEDVLSARGHRDGILEMRVPNPATELPNGLLGGLAGGDECMVGIPEQRDRRRVGPLEDVEQRW